MGSGVLLRPSGAVHSKNEAVNVGVCLYEANLTWRAIFPDGLPVDGGD